jgi:hypothetical protein
MKFESANQRQNVQYRVVWIRKKTLLEGNLEWRAAFVGVKQWVV